MTNLEDARTPADDAGVRAVLNARAAEVVMHAGITGDPATRAEAERLRALANGDIRTARLALTETQRDEAKSEVDSLRAEVERLRDDQILTERRCDVLEIQRNEARALLTKVVGVVDGPLTVDAHLRSANGDLFISAKHLRAILAAADPVSLADVREPCSSCGYPEAKHPIPWCPDFVPPREVTDHG